MQPGHMCDLFVDSRYWHSHCLPLPLTPFAAFQFFAHMPCLSFVQRTREVLGEKGRRIRELTALVQKRFGFPEFFGSKQKGQNPKHVTAWTIFFNVLILLTYTMSLEKGMISGNHIRCQSPKTINCLERNKVEL